MGGQNLKIVYDNLPFQQTSLLRLVVDNPPQNFIRITAQDSKFRSASSLVEDPSLDS
jgi:hypothetical protein